MVPARQSRDHNHMSDLLQQLQPALGLVALAIASLALLDAGARIAHRLLRDPPLAVLGVGTAIAATWGLVSLSLVLLFLGQYRPWAVTVGSVAIALLARRLCKTAPPPWQLVQRAATALRVAAGGPGALVLLAVLGALAWQTARGLLLPPLSWDSLTYHMTIAARWVQDGGYSPMPFPDALWDYGHYPNGGELIAAFLLLPFHSDLLANCTALPFLLLAGAATCALARELGAGLRDALLLAAVVMVSPPLFAYVTTQYVDVQVTAEALAAALFLVRSLRTGASGDRLLAFAAVGLAAGTKQSALALCAVGTVVLIGSALRRRSWTGVPASLLAMIAVSAPWYLRNWIETGNPLFPFAVTIGGRELLAGSIYRSASLPGFTELPESAFLQKLLIHAPNALPDDLALTFGPKLPLLVLLGIAGIVLLWRAHRRAAAVLLTTLVAVEVLAVAAPGAKVIRDRWPEVTHRFFATSVAILAASSTLAIARAPRILALALRLLLAGFLVWDLALMNKSVAGEWLLGGTTALVLLAAGLALLRIPHVSTAVICMALAVLAAVPLQTHRDGTRYVAYARARDVHGIFRAGVPGWEFADDLARPHTIAFASGWGLPGHHWLVYPLFGRRLQNRVLHVPPVPTGGTWTYAPGAPVTVDGEAFARRLLAASVDLLFSVSPWEPELPAVETTPRHFRLQQSADGYRIHEVR
jgi:hypothetical protein